MLRSLLVALVVVAACKKEPPKRVMGTAILKSPSKEVYVAPGGAWIGTLADAAPAGTPGAPQDVVLGALTVAKADGTGVKRLGGGVPNLPGNVLFSSDGKVVAYLTGYSVPKGQGELRVARLGDAGEPVVLAPNASYFTFSKTGDQLAWVSDGELSVRNLASGATAKVADGVAIAEFDASGTRLFAKRAHRTGGALLVWEVEKQALTAIAAKCSTFTLAPAGNAFAFQAEGLLSAGQIEVPSAFGPPQKTTGESGLWLSIGDKYRFIRSGSVSELRFSPDAARVAFTVPPEIVGPSSDLFLTDGREPKIVARRVASFLWAADGSLLLLGSYDHEVGTLGAYTAAGTLVEYARNVQQFALSTGGGWVLASVRTTLAGSYTVGLAVRKLAAPPEEKAKLIDGGVFGYVVDEGDRRLAYKARCTEAGKACSLFVVDLETVPGVGADAALPTRDPVTTRVAAFSWLPKSDDLLVITTRHVGKIGSKALMALGLVEARAKAPVLLLDDQIASDFALAGDAMRTPAYIVNEAGREGLYVAALPSRK